MATKTISITEDAYERLASKKTEGESFSDVIMKITGGGSLWDIAGILSKEESTKMRKVVDEIRNGVDERVKKTAERMKK